MGLENRELLLNRWSTLDAGVKPGKVLSALLLCSSSNFQKLAADDR